MPKNAAAAAPVSTPDANTRKAAWYQPGRLKLPGLGSVQFVSIRASCSQKYWVMTPTAVPRAAKPAMTIVCRWLMERGDGATRTSEYARSGRTSAACR